MKLIDPEAVLLTERLRLEPILPAHAPRLFGHLQEEALYRFIPHVPPASEPDLARRYARWAHRQSEAGDELWLNYAVYRPAEAAYVGTLQATILSPEEAYVAYETFAGARRQHVAQEGCRALVQHLFTTYQLAQVLAHVDTRNVASWKLLESLGFARVKTLKDADHFKGEPSDEYVYQKLRPLA